MTVRPMPERAGNNWPSRVRVPSGNKIIAPPASKRSRIAFNPLAPPPSRSTGTEFHERSKAPMPGKRNRDSRAR